MKKTLLAWALVFVMALFSIAACAPDKNTETPQETEYTVTFDLNYEGAETYSTQKVKAKSAPTRPSADPTRERYAFEGWFNDKEGNTEADFERAVNQDTTFYAKWKKTVAVVTLDPNYPDAVPATMDSPIGEVLAQPADPAERDGYLFETWYADKSCTQEYDFTQTVTDDFTLYAGWTQVQEEDDRVTVTFLWNYEGAPDEGVYKESTTVSGRRVSKPADPARPGYSFRGWFTDTAHTSPYSLPANPTEDVTLYAYWMQIWTFEAEDTDLSGIVGSGYSGELTGSQLIFGQVAGASGGKYLAGLNRNGNTVVFEIEAEEAVENVVLALSLSCEQMDISFTSEEYLVQVNENNLTYESISLTKDASFMTYIISTTVSLRKGHNVIKLITNNDRGMVGTMYATAPMVDCMYLYSNTALAWSEGYPKSN